MYLIIQFVTNSADFFVFVTFMLNNYLLLAPAVTVGETEGAMDSASVFFFCLYLYKIRK